VVSAQSLVVTSAPTCKTSTITLTVEMAKNQAGWRT